MNLKTEEWEEFYLKDLYFIKMGNGFDKVNMNYENPNVNFVSRQSYNNGVDEKVDYVDGIVPFNKGLVTVALGGSYLGSCFVQEEPFYTGQNVAVMESKFSEMNKNINIFISCLVRFESRIKYYAFGRELNSHINNDFTIKLPIKRTELNAPVIDTSFKFSKSGFIPDWNFINQCFESFHYKTLKTKNKKNNITNLLISDWKEFKLTDLFDLERGSISSLSDIEEGEVPIVSAGGENQGIAFYGNVSAKYHNMITVSMNGVNTGFTAYHDYPFTTNADCCALKQKFKMNSYIGLFMVTIISLLKIKYSYGRKMTIDRLKTEYIKLPIIKDEMGNPVIEKNLEFSKEGYVPDWKFMENYIKNLPYGDRLKMENGDIHV